LTQGRTIKGKESKNKRETTINVENHSQMRRISTKEALFEIEIMTMTNNRGDRGSPCLKP
jgi:hypothetical protein